MPASRNRERGVYPVIAPGNGFNSQEPPPGTRGSCGPVRVQAPSRTLGSGFAGWGNDVERLQGLGPAQAGGTGPGIPAPRIRTIGRDAGEGVTFVAVFVAVQLAMLGAVHLLHPALLPIRIGSVSGDVLSGITAVIAVGLYFVLVRRFERRFAVELGASARAARLGVTGMSLGILLFSLVMATLLLAGRMRVSGGGTLAGCAAALFGSLFAAVNEELLFRGMVFRLVERHAGIVSALVVSAVLFGLVHAVNPGATWLSSTAIALEAGVLLGAAYAATRSLWFPIGLHFGWNFTESGLFGANVSGYHIPSLFRSQPFGSTWLTGGAFGPEAGLPAIVVCLAASLILLTRLPRQAPPPR